MHMHKPLDDKISRKHCFLKEILLQLHCQVDVFTDEREIISARFCQTCDIHLIADRYLFSVTSWLS